MILKIRRKLDAEGFTLIELMIVVAIIGILAAVAIPAFIDYIRKSKTSEVPEICDKMYKGVVDYFEKPHGQANGVTRSSIMPTTWDTSLIPVLGWVDAAPENLSDESNYIPPAAFSNTDAGKGESARQMKFVVTEAIYGGYKLTHGFAAAPPTAATDSFQCEAWTDIDDDGTLAHYHKAGTFVPQTRTFQAGALYTYDADDW